MQRKSKCVLGVGTVYVQPPHNLCTRRHNCPTNLFSLSSCSPDWVLVVLLLSLADEHRLLLNLLWLTFQLFSSFGGYVRVELMWNYVKGCHSVSGQ